jgi:hypothetical protein
MTRHEFEITLLEHLQNIRQLLSNQDDRKQKEEIQTKNEQLITYLIK